MVKRNIAKTMPTNAAPMTAQVTLNSTACPIGTVCTGVISNRHLAVGQRILGEAHDARGRHRDAGGDEDPSAQVHRGAIHIVFIDRVGERLLLLDLLDHSIGCAGRPALALLVAAAPGERPQNQEVVAGLLFPYCLYAGCGTGLGVRFTEAAVVDAAIGVILLGPPTSQPT
jgi:hypothetical protein